MNNIYPNWPAPTTVRACTTTRKNGFSTGIFESNNFGLHVGDDPDNVKKNRLALYNALDLTREPEWLEQIHSNHCVIVEEEQLRQADAAITRQPNRILAIMTGDCLPILLCNKQGNEVAAIHAGWRGLVAGVIENTLTKMQSPAHELLAWIGPAICQNCYEVDDQVYNAYMNNYPFAASCFKPVQQKWLASMPGIAEKILQQAGLSNVYQANLCTFEQKNDFFSYRRDGQTGRMVTIIWLTQ